MTKELIKLYKTLLFTVPQTTPTLKAYVIVDSIRDEKVKEKILFSDLKHIDLWHDELFENEQEVPLYLIELEKDNALLDYLLNNHKKSIATYFISPYSLETLQMYYSMFTHVNIEVEENNSNKGIFGFYDPNILPNYMQTLYSQEKIDEFFSGVAMWLVPDVDDETLLYIAYKDKETDNIEDVKLNLNLFLEEQTPYLNFDNVTFPTEPNLVAYVHDVMIDHKQVEIFDEMEKIRFIDGIFREYEAEGQIFYYNKETNKELAFNLFDEAKNINILSEAGIYRYILLGLTVLRPMNELKFYGNIVNSPSEASKIKVMDEIMNKIIEKRREVNGI